MLRHPSLRRRIVLPFILLVLFIVFLPKGIVGSIVDAVRPRRARRLAV